jgi:hypothetical protein
MSLARKLRSSVRTGRNLHLQPAEIAVLLTDEIYSTVCRLEAEELRNECARDADNDNKLGLIISGNAPEPRPGKSAGSIAEPTDALARAARARALSEVKLASRRSKP